MDDITRRDPVKITAEDIKFSYERRLKPLGYQMTYEIADRPNGFRGDVAVFLRWE
mgnify:CR=1 FL=1